jgi:hypothetical protein
MINLTSPSEVVELPLWALIALPVVSGLLAALGPTIAAILTFNVRKEELAATAAKAADERREVAHAKNIARREEVYERVALEGSALLNKLTRASEAPELWNLKEFKGQSETFRESLSHRLAQVRIRGGQETVSRAAHLIEEVGKVFATRSRGTGVAAVSDLDRLRQALDELLAAMNGELDSMSARAAAVSAPEA